MYELYIFLKYNYMWREGEEARKMLKKKEKER